MRVAFLKDIRDTGVWCDNTYYWKENSTLEEFLHQCKYRIQCLGFINKYHPDILVTRVDADKFFYIYPDRIDYWKQYFDSSNSKYAPNPNSIDFNKYDLLICTDPWLTEDLMQSYPKTVFCYWDHERFVSYYKTLETGQPIKGYDLHLDHLTGPDTLQKLPATIYLHYPAGCLNFKIEKKTRVATDRRTLIENPLINQFKEKLMITFSPQGIIHDLTGLNYIMETACCKYFIYNRTTPGGSGQAAMLAASVGCVVIGYHWGKPFQSIVHPFCKMEASQGYGEEELNNFLKIIDIIENNNNLYQEIIEFQNQALIKELERFENILQKAIDLKCR